MTDQGWMVDDGTCDPCVQGNHHRCAEPMEWAPSDTLDLRVSLTCCCNEGYHIGYADPPEVAP